MTTSSTSTESAFNPFTAGIEFMQQFSKNMAANSGLGDGAGAAGFGAMAMPKIPGMPEWAMPTMDPAELDKRINELKTVLFWLEQNANALKASVQALEVQKMTLETLKSMSAGAAAMAQSSAEAASGASASRSGDASPSTKGARRSKAD
jgi:ribosomal protein L29